MEYIRFILLLVNIRQRLNNSDRSHRNKMITNDYCAYLEKHAQAFKHLPRVKLAAFYLRNADKILAIIPGEGSKCNASLTERHITLTTMAEHEIN